MEVDLLLKMQKKVELFSCFLSEYENAKKDVDNDCHSLRNKFSPRCEEIVRGFFNLFEVMNKRAVKELSEKIRAELLMTCKHQFIEDDIECNIDCEMHIKYCIICGNEKEH
jgi:hypothetical protein